MNKKLSGVFLVLLFLLSFSSLSFANAVFKIDASNYTLGIGDTEVIRLYASIEEQTSGQNGINLWQLDLFVDVGGVVSVTDVEILQPAVPQLDPLIPSYVSINSLLSGNVLGMSGAALDPPKGSGVGVGGFTLLANITIEGLVPGQVTYDMGGDTLGFNAYLRDFDWGLWEDLPGTNVYDSTYDAPYIAVFQEGNNVFEVVPEPSSLVIMTIMAGLALRRRKTGVVR